MTALLGFLPSWAWRWIAIAAVGASLFGYGYVKGYSHEGKKLAMYQAQVDAIGKEAAARAAATKAAQDKATKEIKDAYENDVAEIDGYYASHPRVVRVREPSIICPVPSAPERASEPHGTASEPTATRPDPGFEKACALDAARVNAWIDFARKNGFPVR